MGEPQQPADVVTSETGWMIERHWNGMLLFWTGRAVTPDNGWSNKPNDGVRFARAEDGAIVLAWLLHGEGRVVEHAWLARPADPASHRAGDAP